MNISKEQILDLRKQNSKNFTTILKRRYTKDLEEIKQYCTDNNILYDTLSQAVFHYVYDVKTVPRCKTCDATIKSFGGNGEWKYITFCSPKCMANDPTIKQNSHDKRINSHRRFQDQNVIKQNQLIHNNEIVIESRESISQKLKEIFKNNSINNNNRIHNITHYLYKNNPTILKSIYHYFNKSEYTISEAIYLLVHDLNERPSCPYCKASCKFQGFILGYSLYCMSRKCGQSVRKDWQEKELLEPLTSPEILDNITIKQKVLYYTQNYNDHSFYEKMFSEDISLVKNILTRTHYLPINCKFNERLYHIVNDLYNIQLCEFCNIKPSKFRTFKQGYFVCSYYCGSKQRGNTEATKGIRNKNYLLWTQRFITKDITILTDKESFIQKGILLLKCNSCHHEYERFIRFDINCPNCSMQGTSNQEKEVANFVKSVDQSFEVLINTRSIIPPLELDIYLPAHKLAIEFNGIYWHSESYIPDRKYHINKTLTCNEKGVNLLHIFSNEWETKPEIIKSIILNKLGKTSNIIYARQCNIQIIDHKTKRDFLDRTHLQGNCNSTINIGLFYDNKLVSVFCVGKRKITSNIPKWEILRFSTELNTQVVGGFAKLLSFFEKNNKIDELVTYADLRYFDGKVYEKNGFQLKHISSPNYWYIVDGVLVHRSKFQKHTLNKFLGDKFNPLISEHANMLTAGYDRIFDCGSKVYSKRYSEILSQDEKTI